jgi:hypothetical protein
MHDWKTIAALIGVALMVVGLAGLFLALRFRKR